jgi:hypothetical protein
MKPIHLTLALLLLPPLIATPALSFSPPTPQDNDVPVTIKELDLEGAMVEFKEFKTRLGLYREEIAKGRTISRETSQILDELREDARPENDFNEGPILETVADYVDGVIGKQVALVDFLESQRYRISYYANKMATSVRPEDLAILFGSAAQNEAAIPLHVRRVDEAQQAIAKLVDSLPKDQFDRDTFRPTRAMPAETRKRIDTLLYHYQHERNGLQLAKRRLELVSAAQRVGGAPSGASLEIDADLLIGQMFGTLDRIRLQMSMDLMYLEQLLGNYARSSQTQEILSAFQDLVEMQGDLEGPAPELAGVLDWLQDSSTRRLSLTATKLARPGFNVPRYSDLLREAYTGARAEQ